MVNKFTLLSVRAEMLKECLKYGRLQALGELAKSYILSATNSSNFTLAKNGFSVEDLMYILPQLGVNKYEIISFEHSSTITLLTKELNLGLILSLRTENLKKCYIREPLQILGELVKSYIITNDNDSLTLKKPFSKNSVNIVFQQLNIVNYDVFVFPYSTSTSIYFSK